MNYYVTIKGRQKTNLFLVDRSVENELWWVDNLEKAQIYDEVQGIYTANKLKFKAARLVDEKEAKRLEEENYGTERK